jgi:hypothetical protein
MGEVLAELVYFICREPGPIIILGEAGGAAGRLSCAIFIDSWQTWDELQELQELPAGEYWVRLKGASQRYHDWLREVDGHLTCDACN